MPLRCASASSAVSVPDSASTWWAESTVPSTSAGSSWESRRSSPSSSEQRRRQWVEGTLAPSSSSASAASSARRRGVPGRERGRGVLAFEQEGLAGERSRPLEIVGRWKGCDREGRCLRLSHEGSTNRRKGEVVWTAARLRAPGTAMGMASSGAPAREAPHIQAESGDGAERSATVYPDATVCRHPRRTRAGRGAGRRADARRAAAAVPAPKRHFDLAKAERELAGAPAPLASPAHAGLEAAARRPERLPRRMASLKGYPVVVNKWASWCVPCRTEFPLFQPQAVQKGKRVALLGVDAATRPIPPTASCAAEPLPYPSYLDHDEEIAKTIRAPANYPITVFFDRRGKLAYVHQGAYRNQSDLADDMRRDLALMQIRRPATSRSSPPRSRCASEVFCGEQGVTLDGDRDGRDARRCSWWPSTAKCSARAGCWSSRADREVRAPVRAAERPRPRDRRRAARRRRGARRARPAPPASACTRRPARCALYERAGYTPYGERFDEEGIEHLGDGEAAGMNELRVDPLTGLKSIIAAGRASRPGGGFTPSRPTPIDPEKDPFLEGHEDRTPPEVWALRPGGGEPDTPGWLVRSVPEPLPRA